MLMRNEAHTSIDEGFVFENGVNGLRERTRCDDAQLSVTVGEVNERVRSTASHSRIAKASA